ncbi:5693_t:CDS:2, partial [Ambispora leptoticha]
SLVLMLLHHLNLKLAMIDLKKEIDKVGQFSIKYGTMLLGVKKSHLALHCKNVPEDIRRYWHNKLIEVDNANKRNSQSQLVLPPQVSISYDENLLRAWNLFKSLNPAYVLPSYTTLSGRLLDEEFAQIQININNDLEHAKHLTL